MQAQVFSALQIMQSKSISWHVPEEMRENFTLLSYLLGLMWRLPSMQAAMRDCVCSSILPKAVWREMREM